VRIRTLVSAEVEAGVALANLRFARVVGAGKRTPALRALARQRGGQDNDFGSGESLMSCQHCTSLAGPGSGLDGSKAGRR
jgi:hypothetical protein